MGHKWPGNVTSKFLQEMVDDWVFDLLNQAIMNVWILQEFQSNTKNLAKRIPEFIR